jgi:hypothetical protein
MEVARMTVNLAGRSVSVAALVAALGGLLAIVGAPLAWASVTVMDETDSAGGLDEGMRGGLLAIILGLMVLLLVVLWLMKVKLPPVAGLPLMPLLTAVLGVLILLVPLATYFTTLLSDESLKDFADAASATGGSFSLGLGFLAEIVAGIVAIAGGGLALLKRS